MDKINWKPSSVIMYDDKSDFLVSVRDELKKGPFQGFVYKAQDRLPHVIDKAVLEKQLEYLKERDEMISDEMARKVLQKEV